jgi:benzoyl-CoA reductase/2-hydroxyglutaryl-CoA dehydratase subunit BcrC/BadD/HgdB
MSESHAWFEDMIDHCYDYAVEAKERGRPIVGIMCEFTPREIILAAGAVPVCLCGGDASTIPSAERDLPANLCPLIKSTYGYHVENSNPFLEMADLVVAETTCDGKKKMFEILGETKATHILELPQKADDPDAFEHWVAELRKLKEALEKRYTLKITDEALRQAIRDMNRERKARRELAALMKSDNPPLTGRELLDYKSSISCITEDLDQYDAALKELTAKQPEGKSDKVRVLLTGVPVVHGAERVVDIIENSGGLVVSMENCTGVKPILEDVDENAPDPIRALAEKYFHLNCAVMTKNTRRMELLKQLAVEYRAECIIDLIWQTCTTYEIESFMVRRVAEDELGLPFLKIETDYSPSDSPRINVRVEALFETVRQKR